MKIFLALCAVLIFITAQIAYAHPPKAIEASYKASNKTLSVTVLHSVKDPAKHYIKTIEIMKMGRVIEERKFTSQTDKSTQKADFILTGVKPGEKIAIEAHCSIYGKLKVEFNLPNIPTTSS